MLHEAEARGRAAGQTVRKPPQQVAAGAGKLRTSHYDSQCVHVQCINGLVCAVKSRADIMLHDAGTRSIGAQHRVHGPLQQAAVGAGKLQKAHGRE